MPEAPAFRPGEGVHYFWAFKNMSISADGHELYMDYRWPLIYFDFMAPDQERAVIIIDVDSGEPSVYLNLGGEVDPSGEVQMERDKNQNYVIEKDLINGTFDIFNLKQENVWHELSQ